MKSKCTTIVKVTTALILAVLMMVGSVADVVGAVVEQAQFSADAIAASAQKGLEIADAANATDAGDVGVDAEVDAAPDLSGFEENEIVRGMKEDLAGTGAKADLAETGYSNRACVKGTWDSWTLHEITDGYTVSLAANTTYEFVFKAYDNEDVFKKDVTITGNIDNYDFNKDATVNAKLKTTVAGDYTFKFISWNGDNCMRVKITYPSSAATTTWTVAGGTGGNTTGGQSDNLFTQTWNATLTQNDMTNTSGNTWTWTKNNVSLPAGKILCKVVKNHSYDTSYPDNNQESSSLAEGTYNVTITFNDSTHAVTIAATLVAKYTLTVGSVDNATVTATYNGTTKSEGQSFSEVPADSKITVKVTPDSGYKCTAVSPSGTGSGSNWTVTMPSSNTTISATLEPIVPKDIYFNNSYTLYGSVYAYVYNKDGSKHTYEYLGARPGTTMTKLDNSNIWHITVPSDVAYVEFISGDSKTTGEMKIPWIGSGETNEYTYPKYTAPYGANDTPDIAHGGTWGNYVWGSNNKRGNEYTVSDGTTMSASNLFTGITATMYDYYVDDEVDGITGKWLTGLASHSTNYDNTDKTYNDPYKTKLNKALSDYADLTTSPLYGITYPLYFGNLNYKNNTSEEAYYYHFNGDVNNSNYLDKGYNALTGLSGTKLAGSTIHHYKTTGTGVSNENGAPMAMFDEDFLSGENSQNATLATILRTSSFPVRKASQTTIAVDPSSCNFWSNDGHEIYAHFYVDNNNWERVAGYYKNGLWYYLVPSGYSNVKFYRAESIDGNWDNEVDAGAWTTSKKKYIINSNFNGGSWNSQTFGTYDYYEYNSSRGKDNVFITDIKQDSKTANINYYAGSGNAVKSKEKGTEGFFPFDYNNIVSSSYAPDKVYLKPNSNWLQNGDNHAPRFAAYFYIDDTQYKWVSMTKVSGKDYYECAIPTDKAYTKVIFCRMNGNDDKLENKWENKYNQTGDLTIPTDNKVLFTVPDDAWDSSTDTNNWSNGDITVKKVNGYSDADKYAHDQGFGMKLTIPFTLNGTGENNGKNADGTAQTFNFSGDDDLWVFVDDKLVLDLGGAHARTTGTIDFASKTVYVDNKEAIASGVDRNGSFATGFNTNANYVHTMTIYYMERGMYESNLKFGFSFHAIPNQFWIDKKIRTKDIINAGFYTDNGQTGTASNKNADMSASEGRFISNFEASYQDESFTVTHKYGNTSSPSTLASGKDYTIDNDTNTYTTGQDGKYPIKHDLGNAFIGQFTKDDYFNLKEDYGVSNKYKYTPVFSVWDQANNNQAITATGDNTSGYTFQFHPTTTVTTGIENTNIKARFENYMKAHTLTLTKEITNATDTSSTFTFQVLFDFDYDDEGSFDQYIAYPLYCDVDGERTQLSGTGTITVKAGQVVEIEEIPENAKVKVVEVLNDTITSYRYGSITLTKGGVAQTKTDITKGITFTMGDADMTATVSNSKPSYSYSIKYNYAPYVTTYSTQSYTVSGVFTEDEMTTYLSLDGSLNPQFQSAELKRTFVNIKAPYEDNFQQTLSFASSTIDETGGGWNSGVYTCEVTAAATTDNKINAYFNLPYAVDASLVPQESGDTGKVAKLNAPVAQGAKEIDCFDWYVTSGKSHQNKTGSAPVFVKAPLILYTDVSDESTKQYFQYWKVTTQGGYGKSSTDITRCYDYEFNLSLFMDSIIEPVYDSTWAQTNHNPSPPTTYKMYERFDPEVQFTTDTISIAFLENSRNQYNNNGNGGRNTNPNAADVIYIDFLLSFNKAYGTTQLNTISDGSKKAGVVVESVGYMDYETGSTIFDYDKDYSIVDSFTSNAESQATAIRNWLTTGNNKPSGVAKSQFEVTALDNKNCLQYYCTLNNRAYSEAGGGQLLNTLQNRYKVFRAYAYIGDVKGNNLSDVKLSDPVYFTIYDAGCQGLDDNANNNN